MLDPFVACPFLVLGLPQYASKDQIITKWKVLMRQHHPDKNYHSQDDLSTFQTQAINHAKETALNNFEAYWYARKIDTTTSLATKKQIEADADKFGSLFEAMWSEQRRAICQRQRNDTAENERIKQLRAENDLLEQQRMHGIRLENNILEQQRIEAPKRKHVQVSATPRFSNLQTTIQHFISHSIVAQPQSFVSCKQILHAFQQAHSMQDINIKIFYSHVRSIMTTLFPADQWKVTTRTGDKGYRGIHIIPSE
jgi:hypothetical protein